MFLNELLGNKEFQIFNINAKATTYPVFYRYWLDALFERMMRLFVWTGTGEVPPKEIEQRLLIQGHTGIAKYKKTGDLTAFFGTLNTPTKYQDEFQNYTVRCPLWSDTLKQGEEVIVINNNSLRNPALPIANHYAALLAHIDVTLINALVNARDSGGVPITETEKQKKAVEQYMAQLYNGKYGAMASPGSLTEYAGSNRGTGQGLLEIIETKERTLKNFYNDIGVRAAFTKRSNTVEEEVDADASLLLLNLSDMLKARQEGAEKVNTRWGTSWSVDLAPELKYIKEEQEEGEKDEPESDTEEETRGEPNA